MKALDLVFEYLIDQKIQGAERRADKILIHHSPEKSPIILAEIKTSNANQNAVVITSSILKACTIGGGTNCTIDLHDPKGLPHLIEILELIAKKYNELARYMDLFGCAIIESNVHSGIRKQHILKGQW